MKPRMKKLLIVDDEAGIIEELQGFLTEEGFDVRTADSGKEGMDAIRDFKPYPILLDMNCLLYQSTAADDACSVLLGGACRIVRGAPGMKLKGAAAA